MLALSLTAVDIAYLEAIKARRRPHSMEAWNRSVGTLKRLASLGLVVFHNNLVFFRSAFEITELGLYTLAMHRDGDYDVVNEGGHGIMRFYY